MKNTVALTLIVISLFSLSCGKSPHLAGDWKMGGPFDIGRPCQVLQTGNDLTFVNQNGNRSRGVFKTTSEVIAVDWDALSGKLTGNATCIKWKNGTWWLKAQ